MSNEMIERLAEEAGMDGEDMRDHPWFVDCVLPRFAALVAEQCAQIAKRAGEEEDPFCCAATASGAADDIRTAFPMPQAGTDAEGDYEAIPFDEWRAAWVGDPPLGGFEVRYREQTPLRRKMTAALSAGRMTAGDATVGAAFPMPKLPLESIDAIAASVHAAGMQPLKMPKD